MGGLATRWAPRRRVRCSLHVSGRRSPAAPTILLASYAGALAGGATQSSADPCDAADTGQSGESAAGVKGGLAGERSERTLDACEHSLTMVLRLLAASSAADVSRGSGAPKTPIMGRASAFLGVERGRSTPAVRSYERREARSVTSLAFPTSGVAASDRLRRPAVAEASVDGCSRSRV